MAVRPFDVVSAFDVVSDVATIVTDVVLRPTEHRDLAFVVALERHPDNAPFVGQWSPTEHAAVIAAADREHWIIERAGAPDPVGFLIAYDLRARGFGVHVKRIVVSDKSRGVGRRALARFIERATRHLAPPYIWLSVFAENLRAQRCYRALGFCETPLTPNERLMYHDAVGGFSNESKLMFLRGGDPRRVAASKST